MASKKKPTGVHAHGCTKCRTRYEDACNSIEKNGLCQDCQGGKAWRQLIENREWKECCHIYSRPVRKEELTTYKLGGEAQWFICSGAQGGCARTQIYPPRGVSFDSQGQRRN